MADIRILLSHEGADYLRQFADVMPVAVEKIYQDTERLIQVYQSVSDEIGPHYRDFINMLQTIRRAVEISGQAIEALPKGLRITADRIDDYVDSSASPPTKKLTKHSR